MGGLPTTALLVQIVFAKFGLHLPLHRQSKDFARLGCEIAKSTMCGWLTAFAAFLNPVLKALEKQVLASNLLYSDDIPEDMLDPGSGKIKIIRFWSYLAHGPDGGQLPQVLFSFTEDRAGRHPSDMLAPNMTASLPPIAWCACSAGRKRDADFTTHATPIRAAMKCSS